MQNGMLTADRAGTLDAWLLTGIYHLLTAEQYSGDGDKNDASDDGELFGTYSFSL